MITTQNSMTTDGRPHACMQVEWQICENNSMNHFENNMKIYKNNMKTTLKNMK